MNRLVHYWDYISIIFGEQDMCRFASFKYEGAEWCSQKAIGWIVLLLSNTKAILNVLQTIYSIDFIQRVLYDRDESYISSCRSDLIKIASLLELIELKFEMKVINDFYDYQNEINSNRCHFNSAIQGRVNPFENEWDIEEIKEQEDSSILVLHSNNQADCEHNISSSSSEGLDNQILSFNINDNLRLPQVSSINESGDEDQNFISAPANQNGEECSEGQIQTSENIDHSLLINEENKLKLPCLHSNEHISQIENKPKYNISSLKHDIQVGDWIESFDLVESMNLYCHSMLKSSNSSIKAMSSSKLKKRDELRKSHHSRTHTLYSDSWFSESNLIEYLMKNQSEIQIRNKSMPKKVHSKELYLDLCKNLRSMKESRRSESRTGSILLIDEPNSHWRTHQKTSLSIAQSNTERLYNSELMEEIKSGIYSCVRRRIFMAERRKHIRSTHPHLLKAHQLSKNVCAECLKPFKDIQIKNASFLTKVMNKLSVSTKIRTWEFWHNNVRYKINFDNYDVQWL